MRNVFLILEEYDHLKRQPGETVQQFSARFNKVYHAMPVDIRPPPVSSHFHFPDTFNPEMAFQLRERNTATLDEMQNIAVDVKANLLIKRSKVRNKEKVKNKEKEQLKSSEAKLNILASTMEEMMQKISIREKLDVQRHHVPLISEKEKVVVPKHFAAHPWYHGLDNDYFMYSIHNAVEDEVRNQNMEEDSPDMICMFNGISSMDDSLKLDWYNDDYTTLDFSKKSATYDWEEEDHLQSRQDNQSVHGNYDSNDQSAENLRDPIVAIFDDYVVEFDDDCSEKPALSSGEEEVQLRQSQDDNQTLHTNQDCKEESAENFQENANCLPLCFTSLLREHFEQVENRKDEECSNAPGEKNMGDVEAIADSEVQPLSLCAGQNSDENTKPGIGNAQIHFDSLPLCFSSFIP
jgi:hypothetical protein